MKGKIKRKLVLFLTVLMMMQLSGDSTSFKTVITSVSNGINGIGMNLFPVSMSYGYRKSFQLIPNHSKLATFYGDFGFSLGNSVMDGNYDYLDGTPIWALTRKESNYKKFLFGRYFNPYAYFDFYVSQQLGIKKNPVTGGNLLTIDFGGNIRYSNPSELTALALSPTNTNYNSESLLFVDDVGYPIYPFTEECTLRAYPWLEGNRQLLNNYLYVSTNFDFSKYTGFNTYDGATVSLGLEWGPSWLFNKMSNDMITSDYLKLYGTVREKITLYIDKQVDDKNWLTIHLGHSNSFGYTLGDVIPQHKIPRDRLRGYFNDKLWLNITLPQFIANDCYGYFQFGINNYLYFGKVANETSNLYSATELESELVGTFFLKLYNFLRFQFNVYYTFNNGIWYSHPKCTNDAELLFEVSI